MGHRVEVTPAAPVLVDRERATPTTPPLVLSAAAQGYVAASMAPNTKRAYRADWQHWVGWCESVGHLPIPACVEAVAEYITELADTGYRPSTVARRLAAISSAHTMGRVDSPCQHPMVRAALAGIRRRHGAAPSQHQALTPDRVRAMLAPIGDDMAGVRDRALLLVGLALAARRSELVALDVDDIHPHPAGRLVTIRRSKTDQAGRGAIRALPYGRHPDTCPVAALDRWLADAQVDAGPVFRAVDQWGNVSAGRLPAAAVADMVKRRAAAAGIDPGTVSAHSLRAGFVTAAAQAGQSERAIAHQTGHAAGSPVLAAYIRHESVFVDNAATELGL